MADAIDNLEALAAEVSSLAAEELAFKIRESIGVLRSGIKRKAELLESTEAQAVHFMLQREALADEAERGRETAE